MADEVKEKKAVFIPKENRQPYAPEYLHMSKKQVLEAEKIRKEKAAKIAAYAKELDEKKPEVAAKAPEKPVVNKKSAKGKSQKPGERI